jgi:hypothetical protein
MHTAANLIKIWQFDAEFGKFGFPFTQIDNVAAVADLGQQHPDWKQGIFEEPKSLQRSRKSLLILQNQIIDNSNQLLVSLKSTSRFTMLRCICFSQKMIFKILEFCWNS